MMFGIMITAIEASRWLWNLHWVEKFSSVVSSGYHSMVQAMSESIGEDSGNTKDYGASQNIMPSMNILNNLACSPTNTSKIGSIQLVTYLTLGEENSHSFWEMTYICVINRSTMLLRWKAPPKGSARLKLISPAKRNAYSGENAFTPVEELVFNIDMSDYDDVRYCCSGANICKKCWPLMTIAIKVIDSALRENFSFTHILWVYSVPCGVHCWVCDARARRWLKFI
ncbi:hypothetical protein C5167_034862 [Papaver somniferum]|uniref:Uncharacterized protein n=1 Tax=Papaver somniferum TaxID=3469 RepID=A0A4Y7KH14_PAPSO|nr:hypothetical protein C5167_034862 [Papaver somniferum]